MTICDYKDKSFNYGDVASTISRSQTEPFNQIHSPILLNFGTEINMAVVLLVIAIRPVERYDLSGDTSENDVSTSMIYRYSAMEYPQKEGYFQKSLMFFSFPAASKAALQCSMHPTDRLRQKVHERMK